ncbi:MAG: 2Fe-2S iron-sulfur cluster-binding protein [Ignavibacteria bacterium]|nr:2Fe-2S iron-sulfur cluster-binding protein [Ignavibacteria bacterium]
MYITIDGQKLEFKKGETILQVALRSGIDIPHFCYHPALSIAGNCRICLVEVDNIPKLVIACATLAEKDMVVKTNTPKVIEAQNAIMEFILINHPLDCPICDEAGECKLQDYAYKYGKGYSRFDEEKVIKDKRVPIGPNVLFDAERCISCSRCIRYCDEISKSHELTFVNRGEKVTIETFPGKQLDNPYSMNVIEICPVGALTSRHFRFRARVWDMSFTYSICPGCARGCNTIIGVRNNEILRIEPRENLEVNQYWLCDYGRLNTYKFVNDVNLRIDSPKVLIEETSSEEKKQVDVDWKAAIEKAVSLLKEEDNNYLFIGSALSTLEDNYTLKKFANNILGINEIYYIPHIDESFGDDILRKSDKTPNSKGVELLGFKKISNKIIKELKEGKYNFLFILNEDISTLQNFSEFQPNIAKSIQLLSTINNYSNEADVLLPLSTYAEINGTYINFQNRIQRLRPAVTTIEQERLPGEFSLSRLDKFGAHNDRWSQGKKFNSRPGWKIIKQIAKEFNIEFEFENSEDVFIELCNSITILKGLDYDKIGNQGYKIK